MRCNEQGLTLAEVLVASTIAVVVIIGIGSVDATRARITEDFHRRASLGSEQVSVALATLQLAKSLERADRINVIGPDNIQVREFVSGTNCTDGSGNSCPVDLSALPGCCLLEASNYRWDQYRLSGGTLTYFRDSCTTQRDLAKEITSLTLQFQDRGGSPGALGSEPVGGPYNNIISYSLVWDNGLSGPDHFNHTFGGEVASRAIAYTDVGAGGGDSGEGLASSGSVDISPPPADCP